MATVVVGVAVVVLLVVAVFGGDDGSSEKPSRVTDETDTLKVTVPGGWDETNEEPFEREGGEALPRIEAAPDLEAYRERRDAPGFELLFAEGLGDDHLDTLLNRVAKRTNVAVECRRTKREPFEQRGYEGFVEKHLGCGDTGLDFWVVAAVAPGGGGDVVLAVQGASEEELTLILDTFSVTD